MDALQPARRPVAGAALHRPEVTEALTRALLQEWARVGYSALSLETVARRAGVGKAALYRRWPSKFAMIADRFAAVDLVPGPIADHGSFVADLQAALRELRRLLRHPLVRRILPDLHAEMPRTPDLARLVRDRVQAPRRAIFADLVQRAVIRREIPATCDVALAVDMIAGLIYWRLVVTGGAAGEDYVETLATAIAAALKA